MCPLTTPPVLITGARGMLGTALMRHLAAIGHPAVGVDIQEADLTQPDQADEILRRTRPFAVIHCAAWTDVDGAEEHPDACRRANVDALANTARACLRVGASLTLVGTDFVFGNAPPGQPIAEDTPPSPQGVYAQTKREAEIVLADILPRHQVVRTAWLYGPEGRHFVGAILRKLRNSDENLRVVADQTGSPTCTLDLAPALVDLAMRPEQCGIFHLVNSGHTTWCELARRAAAMAGYDPSRIAPIPSSQWPAAAPRPAWSVLACPRAEALGIAPLRPWQQALAEYVLKFETAPK